MWVVRSPSLVLRPRRILLRVRFDFELVRLMFSCSTGTISDRVLSFDRAQARSLSSHLRKQALCETLPVRPRQVSGARNSPRLLPTARCLVHAANAVVERAKTLGGNVRALMLCTTFGANHPTTARSRSSGTRPSRRPRQRTPTCPTCGQLRPRPPLESRGSHLCWVTPRLASRSATYGTEVSKASVGQKRPK